MSVNDVIQMTIILGEHEEVVRGREAFALNALVETGTIGVTPLTWVGPRWSEYIRKLRCRGFDIQTIDERHGGPYAGRHGRYVLRSPVQVINTIRAGDERHAS